MYVKCNRKCTNCIHEQIRKVKKKVKRKTNQQTNRRREKYSKSIQHRQKNASYLKKKKERKKGKEKKRKTKIICRQKFSPITSPSLPLLYIRRDIPRRQRRQRSPRTRIQPCTSNTTTSSGSSLLFALAPFLLLGRHNFHWRRNGRVRRTASHQLRTRL